MTINTQPDSANPTLIPDYIASIREIDAAKADALQGVITDPNNAANYLGAIDALNLAINSPRTDPTRVTSYKALRDQIAQAQAAKDRESAPTPPPILPAADPAPNEKYTEYRHKLTTLDGAYRSHDGELYKNVLRTLNYDKNSDTFDGVDKDGSPLTAIGLGNLALHAATYGDDNDKKFVSTLIKNEGNAEAVEAGINSIALNAEEKNAVLKIVKGNDKQLAPAQVDRTAGGGDASARSNTGTGPEETGSIDDSSPAGTAPDSKPAVAAATKHNPDLGIGANGKLTHAVQRAFGLHEGALSLKDMTFLHSQGVSFVDDGGITRVNTDQALEIAKTLKANGGHIAKAKEDDSSKDSKKDNFFVRASRTIAHGFGIRTSDQGPDVAESSTPATQAGGSVHISGGVHISTRRT